MVDGQLNWLNWFPFFILEGDPLLILIDCMSLFLYVSKMSLSTVSLSRTARIWNSLPVEWFL